MQQVSWCNWSNACEEDDGPSACMQQQFVHCFSGLINGHNENRPLLYMFVQVAGMYGAFAMHISIYTCTVLLFVAHVSESTSERLGLIDKCMALMLGQW
jgi:hypothetical protein